MAAPQTEVLITVAGSESARFVLTPGDYVIGRNEDCPIRVDADLVSRRHALLILNYDHALIEDLGSSNGTQVNGQPIAKDERTRLWPNQKIQVGTATIELRRLKVEVSDLSLAPSAAMVKRILPEEFLREKKYDIGKVVAQGGMGAILNAREATTERTVAMKVMLDTNDADGLARFLNEAKITAQLEHPNIVPVHELSVDENGQPYYTMKMVRGITLKKVLELMAAGTEATQKKYPLPALLTIFQKVCDALAFAHSKGVIHRDLKPENLMLGDYGEVLVMDWGLAKRMRNAERGMGNEDTAAPEEIHTIRHTLAGGAENSALRTPHSEFSEATMAGTIMGTPQFMSPEQARGENETLDARSDIYSLGAILYQMLSLRVPVTGTDAMEVVGKVGRGEIEPLVPVERDLRARSDRADTEAASDAGKRARRSRSTIPDSLAAVVRQAMALDREQRYASVAQLQRDIESYQTGFATSAEKAGWWKRASLAIKRNKAASIGAAAVLLVGAVLGTKAILEGKRAEREAAVAKTALENLKASAPALLQLAESEADSQRFASALGKLDAALALDPALAPARWQRAWVLLGLERWSEAADALRLARQHDPAAANLASILPAVEKLAAAPDAERWKSDAAKEVFHHLQTVAATGSVLSFTRRLKIDVEERRKLIEQRLLVTLGKGNYQVTVENDGSVKVTVNGKPIRSFESLRGLPLDILMASSTPISDLEALRGMRLRELNLDAAPVSDLRPLAGMPLSKLNVSHTKVIDLTPIEGMPLTEIQIYTTQISRIDALRGMPLIRLGAQGSKITDISPLKGAPIEYLTLDGAPVTALSALRGAPLKELSIPRCNKLTDYTPVLTLARLERLSLDVLPASLLPLRESKTLQTIDADAYPGEAHNGPRPVAEFWKAYDAHSPAGKK